MLFIFERERMLLWYWIDLFFFLWKLSRNTAPSLNPYCLRSLLIHRGVVAQKWTPFSYGEILAFSFFFFLFSFIFISWRLITLQYCSDFFPYIDMNQPWIYMCSPSWFPLPPPSPSHPSGSSQCTSPEHLSHAYNLGWWSVSPLIVYLFQCYSFRTSHLRLLPQSPKVCSVHLCLFFCFVYRVRVTIFLNSIYMR